MAGETVKCEAVCLSVRPWSQTSHVVAWLTPNGRVVTAVKGAVRPKSAFLGQYDLNYTCEIVYYAGSRGDVHALRECTPIAMRESLREDFRALALAGYFRSLAERFAPQGEEAREWLSMIGEALDRLAAGVADPAAAMAEMLFFDMKTIAMLGLDPGVESQSGAFALRGERRIPVSPEVAELLLSLSRSPVPVATDLQVALDAARVIGIYYTIHLELPSEARRAVLAMATKTVKRG